MTQPNMLKSSGLKELLLFVLRRRRRARVVGSSMLPLLQDGDEVLFDPRAFAGQLPLQNDLVVAWHPSQNGLKIIKRIAHVDAVGNCFLQGDNLDGSTDSRHYGAVSAEIIIGRVTSRFGN